ncbi:hypothetical protein M747DRAFT_87560 [Aspergillus niger ATCC 13496]|uniref:Uncharacterized protein n=3 Tax=Aspergillus niger TaxID=5061 RepID=A2RB70_ASPNC|nr:hypothetical protein An18g05715 [Aspergillus niger]RDH24550.1 hypothetical protein M747DRAFT_87560 [Aspergillus niger ATCC 13496]CAK97490.1 hypothetical protein An18g05715 [Aspergillus niger]
MRRLPLIVQSQVPACHPGVIQLQTRNLLVSFNIHSIVLYTPYAIESTKIICFSPVYSYSPL